MDETHFVQISEGFARVTTLDELTALLAGHAARLGFESFVYAFEVPDGPPEARLALVNGYPEAWIERYFEQGYFGRDPVMAYVRENVLPVAWKSLTSERNRVMDEATEFGLRYGLSAPIHGPRFELGVLSFATGLEERDAPARVEAGLLDAHVLAAFAHEGLGRVLRPSNAIAHKPLTPRERECLLWVGEGKTSWEIGLIIGASERTVNFHLSNAAAKLGVAGRRHAVAKALLLGLLRSEGPVRNDR